MLICLTLDALFIVADARWALVVGRACHALSATIAIAQGTMFIAHAVYALIISANHGPPLFRDYLAVGICRTFYARPFGAEPIGAITVITALHTLISGADIEGHWTLTTVEGLWGAALSIIAANHRGTNICYACRGAGTITRIDKKST